VSSDFNLAPMGSDLENILSRSLFIAMPVSVGTFKDFKSFRVEFASGIEYACLVSQREQNISTKTFTILEEELVDIRGDMVQSTNIQLLANLILSTSISRRIHTYIGIEGLHGFSDLDTRLREQKINRIAFRVGVRTRL
jgi:hypothetical protein